MKIFTRIFISFSSSKIILIQESMSCEKRLSTEVYRVKTECFCVFSLCTLPYTQQAACSLACTLPGPLLREHGPENTHRHIQSVCGFYFPEMESYSAYYPATSFLNNLFLTSSMSAHRALPCSHHGFATLPSWDKLEYI